MNSCMLRHKFTIVFKWLSIADNPTVLAYIPVMAKVSFLLEFRGLLSTVVCSSSVKHRIIGLLMSKRREPVIQ